jgi:hypothetical protein
LEDCDQNNRVLDIFIESMNKRFSIHFLIYLSFLSLSNLNLFKSGLPTNSLSKLSNKIKPFIDDNLNENRIKNNLPEELINFRKSWNFLKQLVDDKYNEQSFKK